MKAIIFLALALNFGLAEAVTCSVKCSATTTKILEFYWKSEMPPIGEVNDVCWEMGAKRFSQVPDRCFPARFPTTYDSALKSLGGYCVSGEKVFKFSAVAEGEDLDTARENVRAACYKEAQSEFSCQNWETNHVYSYHDIEYHSYECH